VLGGTSSLPAARIVRADDGQKRSKNAMAPTADENKIVVTVFPRGEKSLGKAVRVTHEQLREFLTNGSKATTKDELGGWCPAQFVGNRRRLERLITVHCAVLDIDNSAGKDKRVEDAEVVTIDKMMTTVKDVDTFIYTSFRNQPTWPKFRVVMPFDRPVTAEEYPKFWAVFSGVLKAKASSQILKPRMPAGSGTSARKPRRTSRSGTKLAGRSL